MLFAYQAITMAKAILCNPAIIVAGAARRLGVVPSHPLSRYCHPIDWPQVSHWVRFVRAKGCSKRAVGRTASWCTISAIAGKELPACRG